MREAAERLDFEKAIQLRDIIEEMKKSVAQKIRNEQKR